MAAYLLLHCSYSMNTETRVGQRVGEQSPGLRWQDTRRPERKLTQPGRQVQPVPGRSVFKGLLVLHEDTQANHGILGRSFAGHGAHHSRTVATVSTHFSLDRYYSDATLYP